MLVILFLPFLAGVLLKTGDILLNWMIRPVNNFDFQAPWVDKPPTQAPSLPEPPTTVAPPNTNPAPKAPPAPKNPYSTPLPSPQNKPFPTPPDRELPTNIDLEQSSQTYTSQVNQSISTRLYGCMLYTPIVTTPYYVYNCNYNETISDLVTEQESAVTRLFAWLLDKSSTTLEDFRANPAMSALLNSVGIGDSIEDFLVDKACDLALVGINFFTKGVGASIIGRTSIIYGCQAILKLSLMYLERNQAGIGNFTVVTNAYTQLITVNCPTNFAPETDNPYPDGLSFGTEASPWEPDTVLLPDTAAFTNIGKYLILYWVLESDPNYKTYYTTWQIPSPIEAITDVLDGDGEVDATKCKAVWDNYFAPINRIQGYQASRLYSEERKAPIAKGHFSDKDNAVQCLTAIGDLTTLTVRERAPFVHSSATEDEYLKVLSHVGEKMILRKVNVVDKTPNTDSASLLLSFKAPSN